MEFFKLTKKLVFESPSLLSARITWPLWPWHYKETSANRMGLNLYINPVHIDWNRWAHAQLPPTITTQSSEDLANHPNSIISWANITIPAIKPSSETITCRNQLCANQDGSDSNVTHWAYHRPFNSIAGQTAVSLGMSSLTWSRPLRQISTCGQAS